MIGVSGLSYPLGDTEWSAWPWNRGWFMFHWDDGRAYDLQATGFTNAGTTLRVDLAEWFEVRVGYSGRRWQELTRKQSALKAFAEHVCRRWNSSHPRNEHLTAVSIEDVYWERLPGAPETVERIPAERLRRWLWVDKWSCD
jgi:hypothetical protein